MNDSKERSRSQNVIINSTWGFINKIVILLIAFASQTVFIRQLGAEYLGVKGLFSNILTMLSLAELGLGSVLNFTLYKPLAEKDEETINRYLYFYKKVYYILAAVIFAIGLITIPLLKYIVKSEIAEQEVVLYYVLYLLNSSISYIGIYRATVINADQKNYIVSRVDTFFKIVLSLAQIAILLLTKSFTLFLCLEISSTVLRNITISFIVKKRYNIQNKHTSLFSDEKKQIVKNVKATFVYKIGQTILNYTDNILISMMLGTVFVGFYSNYLLIVSNINAFISIITSTMISSIGNLSTENNSKNSYKVFNELLFFYHFLSSVGFVCLTLLFNNFIHLWLGDTYVLTSIDVVAITLNFYIAHIINPVWMYREAYGLFNEIKYTMLAASLINIILSIALGFWIGLGGIVIATGLSRILTVVWYEPRVLFKKVFKMNVSKYFITQIKYVFCTLISLIITYFITNGFGTTWLQFVVKTIVVAVVSTGIFLGLNIRNENLKSWKQRAMNVVCKR